MKAQAAIDMIREAYKRARSSRTPLHIVADASAGYRITPKVNPDDTVLFTDIVPPAWDDALETAKIKAFFEFSDAGPALQRVAEIAGKHPDAVDEIAEAVMRRYFDGIIVADTTRSVGSVPERPGLFTRMFGTGWW